MRSDDSFLAENHLNGKLKVNKLRAILYEADTSPLHNKYGLIHLCQQQYEGVA